MGMRILVIGLLIGVLGCSQAISVEKGELAPDFTLDSIDGRKVTLTDYRYEKVILLVFWATWCPFCVEEIPELNRIVDNYKDKVEVLGIDIREDLKHVRGFIEKKGIKYTVLLDSTGEVAKRYGVVGIPKNVLIDKEGRILYKGHSVEECEEKIKENIK